MEKDFAAWRALNGAHSRILSAFDSRLVQVAGLSSGEFEILKHLKQAGGRLRMSHLADLVYTSRSGLTRRIDRLGNRGFVERESAAEDGRGQNAVLLQAGNEMYEQCLPAQRQLLLDWFGRSLDQDELAALTNLLTKLIESESAVQVG
ncbi:MAG: MarR family winged helix-turn-helix transcriptional regulator [Acidimicrobiia bacterium]|nr:MarR family winged helix-turn-helix transcriptional regulator [Acidimicrobiia bacterium]MDH5505127.1 MarR family winged helix-turn-helix transcriptional regulator [Acidimicrobiia bacterium]